MKVSPDCSIEANRLADRASTGIPAPSDAKLLEWLAVLCVAGIPYHLNYNESGWTIQVALPDEMEARRLLDEHENSHCDWPPQPVAADEYAGDVFSGLWSALWGAHIVGLFYLWLGPYSGANAVLRAAGGRRSALRAGESWRAVTALMVHADVGHLVSNLLFLALFAALVNRVFGGGLGWLLILAAGAFGNALVAWTTAGDGVGIGASTACFGALGLLAAHGVAARFRGVAPWRDLWRKAWVPIAGGLAMLSMTGAAPGTDVAAHFFGFTVGLFLGMPPALSSGGKPRYMTQSMCVALALIVVAASWALAWRHAA